MAIDAPIAEHWPLVGRRSELEHALAQLRVTGSSGVAVHGPPGVGRSRFTAELLADLIAEEIDPDRQVLRAVASASVGTIPFGAIAHLLPPETLLTDDVSVPIDPVQVLLRARASIATRGPVVLAIDDAHLLDALSLTLLHQLTEEETVRIVVTVRGGEPEPDGLSALWRTGRIGRMDLDPLDDDVIDTLLHLGLAGPVDGRTARLIREASEGIPLIVRELVRSAIDAGALTRIDGVWRLDGPLPSARRAVELVAGRLGSLDQTSRDVLELLVLAGETPLDLVDDIADHVALEQLEEDGLIAVRTGTIPGDRFTVVVARHAVADAVRQQLTPLRSRRILRTHADRFEGWPERRPEDELRIAGWRLDAGIATDAATLEQAATLARHAEDFTATARFAEAADRSGSSLRAAVLWGDALYELGRWEECEQVFAAGATRRGNAFDRLRLVSARGTNLLFGLMRGDQALAMTRAALAEAEAAEPQWLDGIDEPHLASIRSDLVSRVALLQMYDGDPAAAIATLGDPPPPVSDDSDDNDLLVRDALRSRVLWAIPGVPAIALSGRTGEAAGLGMQAFGEHSRLGGEVALSSVGIHMVTLCLALQEHGDFGQARAIGHGGYEATLESGGLLDQIWFGLNLARIGLLTGHPEVARRWGREVLAATSASRWLGPRLMALTGTAAASAQLGDLDAAAALLDEADAIDGSFGFLFPERSIGRAWLAAAHGHLDEARTLLLAGADLAAVTGHLTAESWLRHEVVRLGAPKSMALEQVARLASLADGSESRLVGTRAAAAAALVADDVAELERVAVEWEDMDCDLAASEMLGAAAEALRSAGSSRSAQAMSLRASAASDRTGGARSFRLTRLDTVVPLSPREREIAGLAAAGVPSKEIAARLYLSVRTVNNHLQNAYTKLGVSSRADVARMLSEGGA